VETEAAAGAHNNQPTNGCDMATETAFAVAAAATAAACLFNFQSVRPVHPHLERNYPSLHTE